MSFLYRRNIALWDMVMACEIEGSADASIKLEELADLNLILPNANIQKIFLNGTLAYDLFMRSYPHLADIAVKMPSTSPANPRFSAEIWHNELNNIFRIY